MSIPDEFVITRQGREYILYSGLLNEAHERGLECVETELIQAPSDENGQVAICKARVVMADGGNFDGIGDASPQNVGKHIAPHLLRMSETRAKARALRDAPNIGVLALEEVGEEEPSHEEVLAEIVEFYGRMPEEARPAWKDVEKAASKDLRHAREALSRLKKRFEQHRAKEAKS